MNAEKTQKEEKANALAKRGEGSQVPAKSIEVGKSGLSLTNLEDMYRFSKYLVQSGMAPKGMSPEGVIITLQCGMELGLSPMQSVQNIAPINGRPTIWGDAALALVKSQKVYGAYWEEATDDELHVIFTDWVLEDEPKERLKLEKELRKGQAKLKMDHDDYGYSVASMRSDDEMPKFHRFTIADAKQAKLWEKRGGQGQDTPWITYPKRMLMWRARGFNLRDNFGDVLKGLITTEEAQDIVDISTEVDTGQAPGAVILEAGNNTDALASRLRQEKAIKGSAFQDAGASEQEAEIVPEDEAGGGKSPDIAPETGNAASEGGQGAQGQPAVSEGQEPEKPANTPTDDGEPEFGESDDEATKRRAKAKKKTSKLAKGTVSV